MVKIKKNGWELHFRKDPNTRQARPMKVLYRNGVEVEHHWADIGEINVKEGIYISFTDLRPDVYGKIYSLVNIYDFNLYDVDKLVNGMAVELSQKDVKDMEEFLDKSNDVNFQKEMTNKYQHELGIRPDIYRNFESMTYNVIRNTDIDELKKVSPALYNFSKTYNKIYDNLEVIDKSRKSKKQVGEN